MPNNYMEKKQNFSSIFKNFRENYSLSKSFNHIIGRQTSEISLPASISLMVIGFTLCTFNEPKFVLTMLEKAGVTVSKGILAWAIILEIVSIIIGCLCLLLVVFTLLPNILINIFYKQGVILGFLASSSAAAAIYFIIKYIELKDFWIFLLAYNGVYAAAIALSCIFEPGNLRRQYEKKLVATYQTPSKDK